MMTHADVAELLTRASMIDNRIVEDETVHAWHELVGDLDLDVAIEAMRVHFRESSDYLLPAHVRRNAVRVREERAREGRRHLRIIEPTSITKPAPEVWEQMVADEIAAHRAAKAQS